MTPDMRCPVCAGEPGEHAAECTLGQLEAEADDALVAREAARSEYWAARHAFAAARKADEVATRKARLAADAVWAARQAAAFMEFTKEAGTE